MRIGRKRSVVGRGSSVDLHYFLQDLEIRPVVVARSWPERERCE